MSGGYVMTNTRLLTLLGLASAMSPIQITDEPRYVRSIPTSKDIHDSYFAMAKAEEKRDRKRAKRLSDESRRTK
jgi:hypothetical protein